MKLNRFAATIAAIALAAGLAGGLATSASASAAPPTIKITSVEILAPPAGPVSIQSMATAKFGKHGVEVTDLRLLVDGRPVPDYFTDVTVYGTLTWWSDTSNPGVAFTISPGKHVLVDEIIGVNGKVLAKSPSLTIKVPK